MRKLPGILTLLALALATLATPARSENTDDDWKWVVDHFETFDLWVSSCDHRDIGNGEEKRCYVRIVDVYAPRPDFGAAFLFLTRTSKNGLRFEFSFEAGTEFEAGGFSVIKDGQATFSYAPARCEGGTKCLITGTEAERFAAALDEDAKLRLAFIDKIGRDWVLDWGGSGLSQAIVDLSRESTARGF